MPVALKRSRLELWRDVIFALFIRHLRSRFNDKFGISWLIIQPVIFILVLSSLRGRLTGEEVHGIPVFIFMLLGMGVVVQFLSIWSSISTCIRKDKPLYAFRQVIPFASFITSAILEIISYIIVLLILFMIAILLGFHVTIDNPLLFILYLLEVQMIALAVGLIFSVGQLFVIEVNKLQALLQRPMIFVSGAFFTLSDIPQEAWPYLAWNPVLHAVELARGAAYESFVPVSAISSTYLHVFTLSISFLALSIYTVCWRRMISR
ncbi:ABC transporter permease [Aliikangiella sp. G2MR2-5]|uniref:ABC transporter permease n=1 Tax=Aliikangiella sp. G2MR2-5 TaxID=2788943 RepID=UPI0018AAFAB6|nr:ABC transporter permease [Aliikangiella sp. G2MR2-5]